MGGETGRVLVRIGAIAFNTYREAVRARLLLGVFALAAATSVYSLVVGVLSLHNEARVVADLGAASISLYSVVVAIVLGSTSLYRELEHKTVFPILSRSIRRWEYLVGKYLGILLTVSVFVVFDVTIVLALTALEAGQSLVKVAAAGAVLLVVLALVLLRAWRSAVVAFIPWGVAAALTAWVLAAPAYELRQLVTASACLSIFEIAIVAGIATLFASFSSPFLTATFTAMVFLIGRSADTLAHLPKRQFGAAASAGARVLARIVPNLHTYVPARPLLLGESTQSSVWGYVAMAGLQAVSYAAVLLVISAIAFRRRDFS